MALVKIDPTATKPGILMVEVTLSDEQLTIQDDPAKALLINAIIRAKAQALIDAVVQEAQHP